MRMENIRHHTTITWMRHIHFCRNFFIVLTGSMQMNIPDTRKLLKESGQHTMEISMMRMRDTIAVKSGGWSFVPDMGCVNSFQNELAELCKLVGVRCEAYQSSAYHKRCLVQIGEIWYVVDPTNNGVKNCKAVDYAAERDRYKNEYFASEEAQILQEQLDMGEKAQKGEITWREYFHYLFPDYTDEQIQSQLGMSYEEYGNLWK